MKISEICRRVSDEVYKDEPQKRMSWKECGGFDPTPVYSAIEARLVTRSAIDMEIATRDELLIERCMQWNRALDYSDLPKALDAAVAKVMKEVEFTLSSKSVLPEAAFAAHG